MIIERVYVHTCLFVWAAGGSLVAAGGDCINCVGVLVLACGGRLQLYLYFTGNRYLHSPEPFICPRGVNHGAIDRSESTSALSTDLNGAV